MLSRNGRRVAFATWIGGRNVVVVDGFPGEPFDSVSWPISFSDDGMVAAYAARMGQDQFCVVGNRKSPAYRSVGIPVLSADGRVAAFAASDGAKWFAIHGERIGPSFDWVGNLTLHRSGHPLAYTAETRDDSGRVRSFVVADGVAGPSFDRVTRPAISDDGRAVAYGAFQDGRWFVVTGHHPTPAEGPIESVFVDNDRSRIGGVIELLGGRCVVGPAGRGPRFEWIGDPIFAPDGRIVYLASRGEMKFLVVDDAVTQLGEWVVWDPVLNPDGSRIGFGARIGRSLYWKVLPIPR